MSRSYSTMASLLGEPTRERLQEPVGGGVDRRVDVDGDSELGCGGGEAVGAVEEFDGAVGEATVSESFRCFVAIELADVDARHRGVAAMSPPSSLSSINQPATTAIRTAATARRRYASGSDPAAPRSRTVSGWVTRCRAIRRSRPRPSRCRDPRPAPWPEA